jgi:hypothetical protein
MESHPAAQSAMVNPPARTEKAPHSPVIHQEKVTLNQSGTSWSKIASSLMQEKLRLMYAASPAMARHRLEDSRLDR